MCNNDILIYTYIIYIASCNLIEAYRAGCLDVIQILLDQGLNPNITDAEGDTLLMVAAKNHPPIRDKILEIIFNKSDVDLHAVNRYNQTTLSLACEEGNAKVINLFLHSGANTNIFTNALIEASRAEHLDVIRFLLLDYRFNLNFTNEWGGTLLMFATKYDTSINQEVLKLLLRQSDVDLNITNHYNHTVLSLGCEKQNTDVVKMLVQNGADPNIGTNPFNQTYEAEDLITVKLLLDHGLNPNVTNEWNGTMLMVTTKYSSNIGKEVMKILLSRSDIDLNETNFYNQTALLLASAFP